MKVLRHRLHDGNGHPVPFRRSPNQGEEITPEVLVMHYTAGASAESSIDWLTDPAARASAHLVIGRDGSMTQLVAFNRKAWHAGPSSWQGRPSLNGWSIGIELDNHGPLERVAGGWRTEWGTDVDDSQAVEAAHRSGGPVRGWHAFSEVQLDAALRAATVLAQHYGLRDVLGHDDVAPARKLDPGPAFPMRSFRGAVLGRRDDGPGVGTPDVPTIEESAAEPDAPETPPLDTLSPTAPQPPPPGLPVHQTIVDAIVRIGPGAHFDKLPAGPLPAGTRVQIHRRQERWCEIDVLDTVNGDNDLAGWIPHRFLVPL